MKKVRANCEQLRERLHKYEKITLSEAMSLLRISQSSARRLFCLLEEQGEGIRVHGGIVAAPRPEYSYEELQNRNAAAKEAIAARAAAIGQDGEVLFLDSGTTLAAMAEALAARVRGEGLTLRIFTNSLVNLTILSPVADVELLGGRYRPNRKDVTGYLAETAVRALHFDRAFLGTDGYAPGLGFTATDFSTARLNELVLCAADFAAVLADGEKLSGAAVVSYTHGRAPDLLITDILPAPESVEALERQGVRVESV